MDVHEVCLSTHNEYRTKHGVPPLKLNSEICKFSQAQAENLMKIGKMQHSQNSSFGENLFMMTSSNPSFKITGKEPVDSWYSEKQNYDFKKAEFTPNTGHFTQVVWKNSSELGIGYLQKEGKLIFVANYKPPGNVKGQFRENVLPLK